MQSAMERNRQKMILLMRSRVEAETLQERDIRCPACDYRIQTVYSDATGHMRVKCPKCKGVYTLNLAYFRRVKKRKYRQQGFYNL